MKLNNIKTSVSFFLEKRKDEGGKLIEKNVPIRISVSFSGNRVMTSTGHRTDFSKWNSKKQRVKNGVISNNETANETNADLSRMESELINFFKRHEGKETLPTRKQILEALAPKPKQNIDGGVYDAFSDYIQITGKANSWTHNSYKKHKTMQNRLHEYNNRLKLQDFDKDIMIAFIYWMQNTKKLRNTTIAKDIQCIFYFLKWATNEGIYNHPDVLQYRPKLKGTDGKNRTIIYLTWDELMSLYNHKFEKESHRNIRDVFCFQCFTGLRYSDVYNLKKTDIHPDKIVVTTLKTSETLTIELNKYSRKILDRHKDVPYQYDKALPVISNQKMNDYLKDVCKIAGVDAPTTIVYFIGAKRHEETNPKYELIGTHAGRRTFVTNALALGIPTEVIMKWTGHKSYAIMKPYMAISDQLKETEMSKWDSKK